MYALNLVKMMKYWRLRNMKEVWIYILCKHFYKDSLLSSYSDSFVVQTQHISKAFFFKILYIYWRECESKNTCRGRGRRRSRFPIEQGAWWKAGSQDPEIMTWAKGRHLTNWAIQVPHATVLITEKSSILCTQLPPVVTSYKTVVQF